MSPSVGACMRAGRTATTASRRWSAAVLLIALLTTALVAGLGHPTASAQSQLTADELGLEIVAGFDDTVVAGTWTPLQVRLAPERPFAGRILVAADLEAGRQLYRRDVEVPAGGAQVHRFVLPGGTGGMQVQVVGADDRSITVRPRASTTNGFLVGVLEGIATDQVPQLTPAALNARAEVVAVEPELVALGPRALEPLATLVVRHQDLAALPDDSRGAIADAVAIGLQLVITNPTGNQFGLPWTPVEDITGELRPTPAAWISSEAELLDDDASDGGRQYAAVRAGQGRITVVTELPPVDAPAVLWEPLLQPTYKPGFSGGSMELNSLHEAARRVLGSTETSDLPSVGVMALFFLVYLLLVGPLNGFVLARINRRELAWGTIPALTVVFAIAAFFWSAGARPGLGSSATAAWWIDGHGQQVTVSAVQSPRQGSHTMKLSGTGWDISNLGFSSRARIEHAAGVDVTLDLQALETGLVAAYAPTDQAPPLQVEAAILDGELRLEITNLAMVDLTEIEVRVGSRFHTLAPSLPAGDTLVDTVALGDELPVLGPFFFQDGGRQFDQFGRPLEATPGVLAGTLHWDVMVPSPGLVWVTAETSGELGLPGPSIDGETPTQRGSFLAVGTTPTTTDDAISAFEVQRDLIVNNPNLWQPGPVSAEGAALVRYRLPAEGRITSLVFSLDRGEGAGGFREPIPVVECHPVEQRDADGNLVEVFESCEQPVCPPDAQSCQFDEDARFCFEDGSCEVHVGGGGAVEMAPQPDFEFGGTLQLWDRIDRQWVDFQAGIGLGTTTDVSRWMSPLGEILVRSAGDAGPLDVSGRGIGATVEEDA